jgi:hypothetical protein
VRDIAEKDVHHLRRSGKVRGELIEQLEEEIVAWQKTAKHVAPWVGALKTSRVATAI